MRRNIGTTMGLTILVVLLMPIEMLLASPINSMGNVASRHTNWYDVDRASNLLNQMQNRAFRVRRQVARLQAQEVQLGWQVQADKLSRTKRDIDVIGRDLVRLDQIKGKLEPWQKHLLKSITPELHEMVYQEDAAIHTGDARESRFALAMTQYPQNLGMIYRNASKMVRNIGATTQYVAAREKMAALKQNTATRRS